MEENILIDQLEDKLIDHPEQQSIQMETVEGSSESYQKDLTERASQILNGTWGSSNGNESTALYSFLLTKPLLHYEHRDFGELRLELALWFVSTDVAGLRHLHVYEPMDLDAAFRLGFHPSLNLLRPNAQVDQLYYYVLGSYHDTSSEEQQLQQTIENCKGLMNHNLLEKVLILFVSSMNKYIPSAEELVGMPTKGATSFGTNIHRLATIVYFVLCVAILTKDYDNKLFKSLASTNFLATIPKVIEAWKQHPSNAIKVRNFFMLLHKLILFEFGDSAQLSMVEDLLRENHALKPLETQGSEQELLTCSPLEFFSLKEDLHDKYPLSDARLQGCSSQNDERTNIPLEDEREEFMALNSFSSSMTNLLDAPRTNKTHSVMAQLPTQTLHLATPISSPPSTPSDFMSGGEKLRKMYHVNQGMPLIYPYVPLQPVPQAVIEADKLLDSSAKDNYPFQQFYSERVAFMKQERGIVNGYDLIEKFNGFGHLKSSVLTPEQLSRCRHLLERVEKFYSECLPQFQSLVDVMMSVISSNKLDVNLRDLEFEINLEMSFIFKYGADQSITTQVRTALFRKLESVRVKDTTLCAVSSVLSMLLQWFKTNNILKGFYFGTVLLDSQYLTTFMDFISDSFNNNALQKSDSENVSLSSYEILSSQNKLLNPKIELPQYDFFNFCCGKTDTPSDVELLNSTPICRMKHQIDENGERVVHIRKFNDEFCASLTNLFRVTNEVLIENMSQRVIMFNETKPTDLLKIILLNFENEHLHTPILHIFKKLTPYQGRKWRASNMDVISRIYMHLRLSLKDDWLSGKDLESDFNSCYDQELALRSLIQFYNMREYPIQMKCLGLALAE